MRLSSFMRTLAFASTHEAIQAALAHGLVVDKAGDPVEGPRTGLTLEDAEAVADVDPSLLSVGYARREAPPTLSLRTLRAQAEKLGV